MLLRSKFVGSAVAAGAVACAPFQAARAQATRNLRVIYFPGASNLPVWSAIAKGFFAAENLSVALTPTPSSVFQFQHLSAGDFDIALTAIDNAIAYDEGQGQAPLPNPADFVAFMGGDNGFLRLYGRPDINVYSDLRGKTLAVDALTTGYAFVLRRMLDVNGLHEGDYTLAPAGGTLQRFQKITSGNDYAATLLTPPYDLQARALGLKPLGNAVDVLGRYQALVAVAGRGWLAANGDAATGFVRAYLKTLSWLYDPANRGEALRILSSNAEGVTPELAAALYPVLIDRANGFPLRAEIDINGVRTVLAIRSLYGRPQKSLTDPSKYYDPAFYRRATGS